MMLRQARLFYLLDPRLRGDERVECLAGTSQMSFRTPTGDPESKPLRIIRCNSWDVSPWIPGSASRPRDDRSKYKPSSQSIIRRVLGSGILVWRAGTKCRPSPAGRTGAGDIGLWGGAHPLPAHPREGGDPWRLTSTDETVAMVRHESKACFRRTASAMRAEMTGACSLGPHYLREKRARI